MHEHIAVPRALGISSDPRDHYARQDDLLAKS